jgi:hypothetical protein
MEFHTDFGTNEKSGLGKYTCKTGQEQAVLRMLPVYYGEIGEMWCGY